MSAQPARILIVLGHPWTDSFCGDLARAYARGAEEAGAEVRILELGNLTFEHVLTPALMDEEGRPLEADLRRAQEDIAWAGHLTFVYPIWWGAVPALLKAFVDRVFLPGFAFRYRADSPLPEKLLRGRGARIVETMDAPTWWQRFVNRAPARFAMEKATLNYCGVRPIRHTAFGQVRTMKEAARDKARQRMVELGRRDASRPASHPAPAPATQS